MFDSVTGMAFGPVFDSVEECEQFQVWFKTTTNFLPSSGYNDQAWASAWSGWQKHLEEMVEEDLESLKREELFNVKVPDGRTLGPYDKDTADGVANYSSGEVIPNGDAWSRHDEMDGV